MRNISAGIGGQVGHLMVNGPEDDALCWDAIDWRLHEDNVRRLRQRIFTAARDGDLGTLRNLQKLMLRSWSNTLLSVRQATQRNAGRKTAGIDGEVALTSPARAELAVQVHRDARSWRPRAGQAGVHTQGGEPCEAAAARDSGDRGPLPSGPGPRRAGTGVGGPVRTPLLRVSSGPWLPRRDQRDLQHLQRPAGQAGVGAGRGPGRGVRQDRSQPAAGRSRVVPGQGHDPGLAHRRGVRERERVRARPRRELRKGV